MQRRAQIIQFMFGALSIVVGFNINLPSLVDRLAISAGFKDQSVGQQVMVGTLVPGAIVVLAFLSSVLYQQLIWPFTGSRAGLWTYALNAHIEDKELPVIGWFRVVHSPWSIDIVEARAYYFDDGKLTFRGDWTSDTVWVADRRFGFIFMMMARGVSREPMPSQYQGFMHYNLRSGAERGERAQWAGHFHDLDDRRGVHGPAACARVSRRNGARPSHDLLLRRSGQLMKCIRELEGRAPSPDAQQQPGATAP
jgi:hypothetical protein